MYPNIQKIHAMKSEKKRKYLHNLILHSITALICSFVWSSKSYSMNHLLFISVPQIWSSIFNPKFLFIVVNVIVIFLVGESKISTVHASPANEMYKEYVERSRSRRRRACTKSTCQEKKMVVTKSSTEVIVISSSKSDDDIEVKENLKEKGCEEEGERSLRGHPIKLERYREEEGESGLMAAEELNKRAEEFIARVNKQRRLEHTL